MIQKRRLFSGIAYALLLFACLFLFASCGEEYNLTFIVDGEEYHTVTSNGEETIALPSDPTKEGYSFSG